MHQGNEIFVSVSDRVDVYMMPGVQHLGLEDTIEYEDQRGQCEVNMTRIAWE